MRWTAAVLVLAGTLALADDAQKVAAPKVVSESEWNRCQNDVESGDALTIEKVKRRRALCDGRLIQREGRILDIAPYTWGDAETVLLIICGTEDDNTVAQFVVAPAEAKVASSWTRWDRVSWRDHPSVDAVGQFVYAPVYETLVDLNRRPAGKEVTPAKGNADDYVAYMDWLRGYSKCVIAKNWGRAAEWMNAQPKGGWTIFARTGTASDRGVNINFKRAMRLDRKLGEELLGFFGVPADPVAAGYADPTLMKGLRPGTPVEVRVTLSLAEGIGAEGSLRWSVTLLRVRPKPTPAPEKR